MSNSDSLPVQSEQPRCHRCGHGKVRQRNGICRVQLFDRADIYSRDCGCVAPFHGDEQPQEVGHRRPYRC